MASAIVSKSRDVLSWLSGTIEENEPELTETEVSMRIVEHIKKFESYCDSKITECGHCTFIAPGDVLKNASEGQIIPISNHDDIISHDEKDEIHRIVSIISFVCGYKKKNRTRQTLVGKYRCCVHKLVVHDYFVSRICIYKQ
jgi:hypothetical protein